MRIKKIAILEAAANASANINTSNTTPTNTSNTTGTQNNNTNKTNLPKPEEIGKSKKAVEDLDNEVDKINNKVKNGPMGAFLKGGDGLTENDYPGGEDYGDNYEDQENFLKDLNSLDESIKNKRKVIKTIKVKDLKNG
jgi:hypothetical protein